MPNLILPTEALQKKLENYCGALAEMGYLNGSVLVGFEGKVLFSKGYGMANLEHEIANTPHTRFRIGSITKQFAAAAVLLLQESGLLNVKDPVARHLPDYPNGEKITIHHLLTHTSGIPSFTGFEDYRTIMKLPFTLEELVSKFRDLPLQFEPGEKFEYCNSGYILLSYLIEKITGKPFAAFLDEALLSAAGMFNSGHDDHKKILRNRASGYEVWGDIINAEFIDMSVPSGAGAMYSTTEDLLLWDQALHGSRVLNHDSYASMITPSAENYGYGVFVYEEEVSGILRKVVGHGGGINGFVSEYRRYVNEGLTVIVLSNLMTVQTGSIANTLARITFGEEVPQPEAFAPIDIERERLESCTGAYQFQDEPDNRFTLTIEDGKLYATDDKWFKYELCPFAQDGESVSFFVKGAQGKAVVAGTEVTIEFGWKKNARRI